MSPKLLIAYGFKLGLECSILYFRDSIDERGTWVGPQWAGRESGEASVESACLDHDLIIYYMRKYHV